MISWHRLFGLALRDLFAGSPWTVELEKDLSAKKQPLDIVIVRRGPGTFAGQLPDGLEYLADHNLLTYKSLREPLDDWTLKELTGHYVNYRKQVGEELLSEDSFRLYGVSTRFPEKLARQVRLEPLREGVYEVSRGTDRIIIVVLSQLPLAEHNALWNVFSSVVPAIEFGAQHYYPRTPDLSTILNRLFEHYQMEGLVMPYTIEQFRRDAAREMLEEMPPEERIKGLLPEDLAKLLSPEERLKGLPPEERLKGLPADVIEAYLRELKQQNRGIRAEESPDQ